MYPKVLLIEPAITKYLNINGTITYSRITNNLLQVDGIISIIFTFCGTRNIEDSLKWPLVSGSHRRQIALCDDGCAVHYSS